MMSGASASPPLFSLGLIADAQYADLPTGDTEGREQRYREVPGKLLAAVADLATRPLAGVLTLGDIVNGNGPASERNEEEFELVASILDGLGPLPAHHVVGNHCLSVPRVTLLARLRIPGSYYSVQLAPGWRLVVLDTTELSGHSGFDPDSEAGREAAAFLAAHPLGPENPQMASWNGGVTQRQLAWLREQLAEAEAASERVLTASHHQVAPGAARATHLAWNWEEILSVLLASSTAFVAHFSGHDHVGGYAERGGRHFVTLEAMLEAPACSNAYGVLDVHPDRLRIRGEGTVTGRELPLLRHPSAAGGGGGGGGGLRAGSAAADGHL